MIEAIIDYIQTKGWIVHVWPHILCIERITTIAGEIRVLQYRWSLSSIDLKYRPIDSLFDEADHLLTHMEDIIQKEKAGKEISSPFS